MSLEDLVVLSATSDDMYTGKEGTLVLGCVYGFPL